MLERFNSDLHTKEALVEFIHSFIDTEALRRIYAKENTDAVADARLLIDKAFEQLEITYAIPERKPEQGNQAR